MPYVINRYQSNTLDPGWPLTIPEKTIDTTSTDISLPGRNVLNWGQHILENLIWLMESFAGPNPPSRPITGQIWFDTSGQELKVWNGTVWIRVKTTVNIVGTLPPTAQPGDMVLVPEPEKYTLYIYDGTDWRPINRLTVGATPPPNPVGKDFYYDPANNSLYVYIQTIGWLPIMVGDPNAGPPPLYDGRWSLHVTNNGITVNVIESNDQVVAIFSAVAVTAADLGVYRTKNGTTIALNTLFPNGLRPGMNLANFTDGIFGNSPNFVIGNETGTQITLEFGGVPSLRLTPNLITAYDPLEVNHFSHIRIPVGTTAQRPATPSTGQFRFNTDTGYLEYYDGTNWISLVPAGPPPPPPTPPLITAEEISPPLPFPNPSSITAYTYTMTNPKFVFCFITNINTGGYQPTDLIPIATPSQVGFDEGSGARDAWSNLWWDPVAKQVGFTFFRQGSETFHLPTKNGSSFITISPSSGHQIVFKLYG